MVPSYAISKGRFFGEQEVAQLEKGVIRTMEGILVKNGFEHISVPSLVTKGTIWRQGVVPNEKVLSVTPEMALAGSAEQGILEYFTGRTVTGWGRIYAENQCFRNEESFHRLKTLIEFKKLEMFFFCKESEATAEFELALKLATQLLDIYGIKWRTVCLDDEPGYHVKKTDIEVWTEQYGWMETHSCTYFGQEQSKRFCMDGDNNHTISCTAVASPRILIPILEKRNNPNAHSH